MTPLRQTLDMALQRYRAGEWHQAEHLCRQVLERDEAQADALSMLAMIAGQTGRVDEAVGCLRTVARLRPDSADVHNNLGNLLMMANASRDPALLDQAIEHYRHALRLRPQFAEGHNNLGNVLLESGQIALAEASFRQAISSKPNYADAHYNLGIALWKQDRLAAAIASHRQAVHHDPDHADAYMGLGHAFKDSGQVEAAIEAWRLALKLKPDYPGAHHSLGLALQELGLYEAAIATQEEAVGIRPDDPQARRDLGSAYSDIGRYDEAVDCYRLAIDWMPEFAGAHNDLGMILYSQGNLDDAAACFARALDLDPDSADAHANQSILWLLQGDFERGWPEYEWRWKQNNLDHRRGSQPAWDGSPLFGKTILVADDQGLGDTIQFIRLAPLVRERGGRVLAEVLPPLRQVLSTAPGIDQLIVRGDETPPFDTYIPLCSLPRYVLPSGLETLPASVPYLRAAPALVDQWRDEVKSLPGFKIGIAWQGSRQNPTDRGRSLPLVLFASLAQVPGVTLVSLQAGQGTEQIAAVANRFRVIDFGDRLDTESGPFMDTAAIMRHLDLVVTCDSAVAHLAGALGVPVWIALMLTPDWRWLLDRDDSPWYPTARLFRQVRVGDWPEVFERMAAALRQAVGYTVSGRPALS
jgi:tetratricopeptide (TPR) repeat protein